MIVAGLAKTNNGWRYGFHQQLPTPFHLSGASGQRGCQRRRPERKRVGVQDHTQQESFLRSHWVNVAEIIRFPTYGQLIDAFCAGQLDAILVDGLSGYEFLQSERGQPFAILDDPLRPTKTSPMPTSASGKTIPN